MIEEYAHKHSICPFEFSLEMANWADVVICHYNYVFDPRVYLRRFFLDGGEYTFLVDEAHNLVERARDMFSAELDKESWLKLKRLTKYETTSRLGYEFAYMYPGLNKVLQAVGRVIRTEEDQGIVLLIDERFSLTSYKKLFPEEWKKGSLCSEYR